MLKFVRQGVEDQTDEEWSSVSVAAMTKEPKEYDDHDCSVCKTRRRSLERQAAHALRRSRSRETLRSIGNNSSTDEEACFGEQSKTSRDVKKTQVGDGSGGWGTKAGRYRRLSRSCEALSASYKHSHWARADDSVDQLKSGLLSRIMPRKSGKFDGGPSGKDLLTQDKEMPPVPQDVKHKQAVTCDCETRKLSARKTGYSQSLCRDGNTRESRTSSVGGAGSSAVKQVQFGGVEYQKPKEESVMGRLLNAVSGHRRKLRSRSLERTDRRVKWSREDRAELDQETMPSSDRTGRPRSKLQIQDKESMTPPPRPQNREASQERMSDYEHQQQRNYKRSRSRSRDRNYRTRADSETRKSEMRQQYRSHENQRSMDSQTTTQRDENCNTLSRRRACSDGMSRFENGIPMHGESYDMQYNTSTRLDCAETGRNDRSQERGDNASLISPHYVAPNGHYGNAVVRKCPREQNRAIDTKRTTEKDAHVLRHQDDTAFPSGPSATSGRSARPGDSRRRSQPRQEKYAVSAQKIASLDSPLKFNSPDPSILENIDAAGVCIRQIGDERPNPCYLTQRINGGDVPETSTRRDSPSPLGFVYNCTTAKISKLTRSQSGVKNEQHDSNSEQCPQGTAEPVEKSVSAGRNLNQCYPPGNSARLEPANDLVRHASVASLSLISVNSVDSGTSCHEGSTTDSSSTSSDKETEALLGPRHHPVAESSTRARQRLRQADTKMYTASTREIENMILSSCFGREAHSPARLVTSDYESDTGPEGMKSSRREDGRSRRKGGASRSVHFAGSRNEMDTAQETKREQQARPRGQSISSKRYPSTTERHTPDRLTGQLDKLTARAHVLYSHKGLSRAEMSIRQGDVVYVAPEDLKQRPLWVVAYSINTGETGLVPSVYLTSNETVRGPSLG